MKPRGRLPAARPRVDRLSIPTPTLPVTGPFDFGPQAQQSKAQLTARRLSIQVTMPLANGRLSRNLLKLLLTLRRLASRPSIQSTGLDNLRGHLFSKHRREPNCDYELFGFFALESPSASAL